MRTVKVNALHDTGTFENVNKLQFRSPGRVHNIQVSS